MKVCSFIERCLYVYNAWLRCTDGLAKQSALAMDYPRTQTGHTTLGMCPVYAESAYYDALKSTTYVGTVAVSDSHVENPCQRATRDESWEARVDEAIAILVVQCSLYTVWHKIRSFA